MIGGGAHLAAALYNHPAGSWSTVSVEGTVCSWPWDTGPAGSPLMMIPHHVAVVVGFVLVGLSMHARCYSDAGASTRPIEAERLSAISTG